MTIGPVQFAQPIWLFLVPAFAVALWLLSRRSLAGLGPTLRWIAFGVRCVVVTGLCATLAQPQHRTDGEGVAAIVVIDGSASMPRDILGSAVEVMGPMMEGAELADRVGLITVAEEAFVRRLPMRGDSPLGVLSGAQEVGDLDPGPREGTNLADALTTALSTVPDDSAARIVLVSDGNETEGSLRSVAEQAAAVGVPVDVLAVQREIPGEVVLDELATPANARVGQTVNVTAVFRSVRPVTGRLTLAINGGLYDLTPGEAGNSAPITLGSGVTPVTIPVFVPRGGAQRFTARFEPDDERADEITQNNIAESVTFVETEGKVLIYAERPVDARPLFDALESAQLELELRLPSEGHRSLEELQDYDAIVLFDTGASGFTGQQIEDLASYVRDSGGGLVMVGGPNGFGAGGWIGTPVADALPVRLDVPERRNMPLGALAAVIDTSGSMAAPIGGTNLTQLDAAEEGAVAAVNSLSRLDLAMIVRFDSGFRTVVPLGPVGDKQGIARKIRSLNEGGGTDMFPALRHTISVLKESPASVRHIVVLSDGQTMDDGSLERVLAEAKAHNISISGISIGDWADDRLMQRIAAETGGLFHIVLPNPAGLAQLPQIFIKEAQIVKRALIWEGDPFSPVPTGAPSVPLRGVPMPVPTLSGYVVTSDREGLSVVTLRAPEPDEDPILAHWQHGLGRVVAFTSDATNRWAADWVGWPAYETFWEQHVRWAMRPTGSANLSVVTTNDGPRTRITVNALDEEGEPLNFARFVSRVVRPDGTADIVELPQTAPGQYAGAFDSSDSGSYLATVLYDASTKEKQDRGVVRSAVSRSYADEYRQLQPNPGLLRRVAQQTGGRVLNDAGTGVSLFDNDGLEQPISLRPIWLAFAAISIGLFLCDVAVRRVRIVPAEIFAAVRRQMSKAQEEATQIDALRTARERAAVTLKRAAPTAESKSVAKTKFEAAPGAQSADPIVSARPPAERPRPTQGAEQKPKAEEGDGMSRLLAAKRRAAGSMESEDTSNQ